jgi:hypothetical protein
MHTHGKRRVLTGRLPFRRADAVIVLNKLRTEFLRGTIRLDLRKRFLTTNGIDTERLAAPIAPNLVRLKEREWLEIGWKSS